MPYPPLSQTLAEEFYKAGYQIMMHIPTENEPPNSFSGKGQLAVGMSEATVFSTLDADLATVPHVGGVNNHQGGLGCNDLELMTYECRWAKQHGFFVVDSMSSVHLQGRAGRGITRDASKEERGLYRPSERPRLHPQGHARARWTGAQERLRHRHLPLPPAEHRDRGRRDDHRASRRRASTSRSPATSTTERAASPVPHPHRSPRAAVGIMSIEVRRAGG